MSAMSAKGVRIRQELQIENLPTYHIPPTYHTSPQEANKLQFGIVHRGIISGGGVNV